MKLIKFFLAIIVIIFLALSFYAFFRTEPNLNLSENNKLFNNANNYYKQKNYNEAILTYKSLISKGIINADIYYNLANSYYKIDQIPKSLINYKNAQKLSPRDPDIKANIKFIMDQDLNNDESITPVIKTIFFWYYDLNLDELIKLTIITNFIVCMIALILLYKRHLLINTLFGIGILILLILFISTIIKIYDNYNVNEGVIIKENCQLKSGDSDSYYTLSKPNPGDEIKLLDNKGLWYKISLKNNKKGWIKKDCTELIDAHM